VLTGSAATNPPITGPARSAVTVVTIRKAAVIAILTTSVSAK